MMVYFMPYYKSAKRFLAHITCIVLTVFIVFSTLANAASSGIHIKSAELLAVDESYSLSTDFDISLSPVIEDALNKGVPLTFLLEFQLSSPRKYWFDDEIVTQTQFVTLSYHALSRQYLVNRSGHQQSFSNLQQAKDDISNIKAWAVVDKKLLKKGESYIAAIKVRLDQTKLPKPVQVEAIGSDDWSIASERYRWTPVLAF
jgi:Domain of unknown function (DUF4390)